MSPLHASPFGQRSDTGRLRLGVLGTIVWDTIHQRDGHAEPVEEWGGVSYALEALTGTLPDEWDIVPFVKIGRDLSEDALQFLSAIPRVEVDRGVRIVPEATNRVELRYEDDQRRCERLTGGVPAWVWTELAPLVKQCDALYVNFISGFEMELHTAEGLRTGFAGPTYADLHSLFLGMGQHGLREPRPLPSWSSWMRCFDAVQMNEEEFELLGRAAGDPWLLAADVVGPDLKLIAVTMGPNGAAYVAGPGFSSDPAGWPVTRQRVATPGPAVSGKVGVEGGRRTGDTTGCGDVWGATFFARLLAGDGLEEAMRVANAMAARNVEHRGARGLHLHLKGRIAH